MCLWVIWHYIICCFKAMSLVRIYLNKASTWQESRTQAPQILTCSYLLGFFYVSAFPDESFFAVICAQSFHWFANAKSVSEICRVLQPGGKYGMIWNHRDSSVPWVRAMQDIIDPFVRQKDMPTDPRELKWMESLNNSGKFTSVERNTVFRTYLEGDMDAILSVVMCISAISQSSKEKRVEVEAKIRDILTNHPDLKGTKVYKLPYITDICWCTKK